MRQFTQELTKALPPNWHHDQDEERRVAAAGGDHPGSLCFRRELRPGAAVRLWLLRISDEEMQGGLVIPPDTKHNLLDVAEIIREFETTILTPTAKVNGIRLLTKWPGPRSVVPEHVLQALQTFLDTRERSWPLSEAAARMWRRFIILAHQSETLLDPDEFRNWLLDRGWTSDKAQAAMDRFALDARLLSEYEDERQPA
jgi:hypothetical protein